MKYTNNTIQSVQPLVGDYLNTNENDLFNYNYWDYKIKEVDNKLESNYKLSNFPTCIQSPAYNKQGYSDFTFGCNDLNLLNTFKIQFQNAMSSDNLKKLFEGKTFNDPIFLSSTISINETFEGNENIDNYITYEKKDDIKERTQKSIEGNYYNYFEDEKTERSIYVLQSS